jgi:hypothetical protein
MSDKKVDVYAKYEFSELEIDQLKDKLPGLVQVHEAAEEKKKEVTAELKNKVDTARANVIKTKNCITNGYEFRSMMCDEVPDLTAKRIKFIDERGIEVDSRAMTPKEYEHHSNYSLI